jgi:hypothetical protein
MHDEVAEAIVAMGFNVPRETIVRLLQEVDGSMDAVIDRLLSLPSPDSARAVNEEEREELEERDVGGPEHYKLLAAPDEDEDAEMAAMLRSMFLHGRVYLMQCSLMQGRDEDAGWSAGCSCVWPSRSCTFQRCC